MIDSIIFLFFFFDNFRKTIDQTICNAFHCNDSSSRCNLATNRCSICTWWNANRWSTTSGHSSSDSTLTNINVTFKWLNIDLILILISEFISKINLWTYHPMFSFLLPPITIKSSSEIIIGCYLFLFGQWSDAWSIFYILIAGRYSHFFLQTLWIYRFILI